MGVNPQLPVRPSQNAFVRVHETRIRRQELGDVSVWHYVTGTPLPGQVNPWAIPDDDVPLDCKQWEAGSEITDGDTCAFINGWTNTPDLLTGRFSPLAFRVHPATKVRMTGHIGEGSFGTPCTILPAFALPRFDLTAIVSSSDGTMAITVHVNAVTGEVTPIGTV